MNYRLDFENTIENWDESIPLGNGDMGCLIWNTSDRLRFSIDKGGIWDCSNSPENLENWNYDYMKKLVRERKQKELEDLFYQCYNNATPSKLPTGKLILDLGVKENVTSSLDLSRAEAVLKTGNISIRSFVHADDDYGMIWVSKKDITVSIDRPDYGTKETYMVKPPQNAAINLHCVCYDPAVFRTEQEGEILYQYFIQPTHDSVYGIVEAQKEVGDGLLIAYTVGMDENGSFAEDCKKRLKTVLELGYDRAIVSHLEWWNTYWETSWISIPDKLIEKYWYLNTYFLACNSRKGHFPMPLQGVWSADNDSFPPWKGDYHHDLNTQMCYTTYLKANHIGEGESFIDFLLDLQETAEHFAKSFFGVDGLCLPSVMDIKGHALGGWFQYTMSPTCQFWLCDIMARHYFFTHDRELLKNRIYPYMEKAGEFMFHILEEKDGKYKLPLSSSPEIHAAELEAWLTPNSNFDLSLMRAHCINMAKLSEELHLFEKAKWWTAQLDKFDELALSEDHVLLLSPDEKLTISHRHHSHCMAIYPLRLLNYRNPQDREIIDATVSNLEELDFAKWTGYSMGWGAQFYVIQGNGNAAAAIIRTAYQYYCTRNGFHVNGDYQNLLRNEEKGRVFTLEGNFVITDAVQEMLLYSEQDGIQLFPALPDTWEDAEIKGFRAYGNILVSAKLKNKKIVSLELESQEDTEVQIIPNSRYEPAFDLPAVVSLKKGVKKQFAESAVK